MRRNFCCKYWGLIFFLFAACHEGGTYFGGETFLVKDSLPVDSLVGEKIEFDSVNNGLLSVCDSLLFFMSHRSRDYQFTCFDRHGHYVASFAPKGRGNKEFLNLTPIIQSYEEQGERKALLTAINEEKAVVFNITKSVLERKTVYDTIFALKWRNKSTRSFISIFWDAQDNILAFKQPEQMNLKAYRYSLPQWYVIDPKTDEILRKYDLFKTAIYNPVAEQINGHFFSSFNLLNEERTKIVMFMPLLPQINILDLETGKLQGIRLSGYPDFKDLATENKTFREYYGFSAIDRNYIYALWLDKDYTKIEQNKSCFVYVFNWTGELKYKLYLPEPINQIQVDEKNRLLYGVNLQMDEVFRYKLPF